jgi:hypothetical protein
MTVNLPTVSNLEKATEQVLKLGKQKEINTVFLTRALNAITHLVEHSSLVNASAAPSDYEVLLRILELPESLELLQRDDPLAMARLRGLKTKQELLEANHGCIKVEEVAKILNISRQAVDKRRRANKLIGISRGKHSYVYPIWQFKEQSVIQGLESILKHLQDYDPWMQIAFMLEPNLRLEQKTPLEELNAGQLENVLLAARVFGEHGSD